MAIFPERDIHKAREDEDCQVREESHGRRELNPISDHGTKDVRNSDASHKQTRNEGGFEVAAHDVEVAKISQGLSGISLNDRIHCQQDIMCQHREVLVSSDMRHEVQLGDYKAQDQEVKENLQNCQQEQKGSERPKMSVPPMFVHMQREMAMETGLSKQNADGDTALHVAIIFSSLSLVWQILHQKVNKYVYNISNHLQQSPLHLAVLTKQALVARRLVVRGANLDARDRHGNTPLHMACDIGDLDLVRALTMPVTAKELKQLGMSENVQDTTADATILNYHGDSPLHLAAAKSHIAVLRYLLLGFARANVNVPDGRSGRTILHVAVETRNTLVIIFLIQNRDALSLDLETETFSGHTAYALAESRKYYDVVRLLSIVGAGTHYDSSDTSDDSDVEMQME